MEDADEEWVVRPVSGQAATKEYRCPGCQQVIPPRQPHVVVWPAHYVAGDGSELRRHWHTACWRREAGRDRPRREPR